MYFIKLTCRNILNNNTFFQQQSFKTAAAAGVKAD